jgi:hypothetical protein
MDFSDILNNIFSGQYNISPGQAITQNQLGSFLNYPQAVQGAMGQIAGVNSANQKAAGQRNDLNAQLMAQQMGGQNALNLVNAQDIMGLDQTAAQAVPAEQMQQAQLWAAMDQLRQGGQNNLDLTSLQGQNALNLTGLEGQNKVSEIGALGPLLQGVMSGLGFGSNSGFGGSSFGGGRFGSLPPITGIGTNYGAGVNLPTDRASSYQGGAYPGNDGAEARPPMMTSLGSSAAMSTPTTAGTFKPVTQQAPKLTMAPQSFANYFPNLSRNAAAMRPTGSAMNSTDPNKAKQAAIANMYGLIYSPDAVSGGAGGWNYRPSM